MGALVLGDGVGNIRSSPPLKVRTWWLMPEPVKVFKGPGATRHSLLVWGWLVGTMQVLFFCTTRATVVALWVSLSFPNTQQK